jgi:chromosome condensin MukBEF complex kleisin-like MukF subunit
MEIFVRLPADLQSLIYNEFCNHKIDKKIIDDFNVIYKKRISRFFKSTCITVFIKESNDKDKLVYKRLFHCQSENQISAKYYKITPYSSKLYISIREFYNINTSNDITFYTEKNIIS